MEPLGASPNGQEAVFRYSIPEGKSHYQVTFCCAKGYGGSLHLAQQYAGYREEIAVNPETGALLRVVLKAGVKSMFAVIKAAILVEYGPVMLGGRTYICPLRSVALMVVPVMPSGMQAE